MKAIIVKNNNFETIGFEVTSGSKAIFSWGISPTLKTNFQKEIDVNDWINEIFELVRIQTKIEEKQDFHRQFFQAAKEIVKDGQPVDFTENESKLKSLIFKRENMIKNII